MKAPSIVSTVLLNSDGKFEGNPLAQIHIRKTDFELEYIPRAIYNDFYTELQLREEGFSGKKISRSGKRIKDKILTNPHDVSESLNILAKATHKSSIAECDEKLGTLTAKSSEEMDTDAAEERTVILTEAGIDIHNFSSRNAILPLSKPKISSPLERPIHYFDNNRNFFRPFAKTYRYGSILNTIASIDDQNLHNFHLKGSKMDADIESSHRKSTLRYTQTFKASEKTIISRGLSFRGRGLLDVRKGWKKASDYTETGDISDNGYDPVSVPVSFLKDLDFPRKPKFTKVSSVSLAKTSLPSASITQSIDNKARFESKPQVVSSNSNTIIAARNSVEQQTQSVTSGQLVHKISHASEKDSEISDNSSKFTQAKSLNPEGLQEMNTPEIIDTDTIVTGEDEWVQEEKKKLLDTYKAPETPISFSALLRHNEACSSTPIKNNSSKLDQLKPEIPILENPASSRLEYIAKKTMEKQSEVESQKTKAPEAQSSNQNSVEKHSITSTLSHNVPNNPDSHGKFVSEITGVPKPEETQSTFSKDALTSGETEIAYFNMKDSLFLAEEKDNSVASIPSQENSKHFIDTDQHANIRSKELSGIFEDTTIQENYAVTEAVQKSLDNTKTNSIKKLQDLNSVSERISDAMDQKLETLAKNAEKIEIIDESDSIESPLQTFVEEKLLLEKKEFQPTSTVEKNKKELISKSVEDLKMENSPEISKKPKGFFKSLSQTFKKSKKSLDSTSDKDIPRISLTSKKSENGAGASRSTKEKSSSKVSLASIVLNVQTAKFSLKKTGSNQSISKPESINSPQPQSSSTAIRSLVAKDWNEKNLNPSDESNDHKHDIYPKSEIPIRESKTDKCRDETHYFTESSPKGSKLKYSEENLDECGFEQSVFRTSRKLNDSDDALFKDELSFSKQEEYQSTGTIFKFNEPQDGPKSFQEMKSIVERYSILAKEPPLPEKTPRKENDSETWLSLARKAVWKDHKCEIKVFQFELHCCEIGKDKPYKPYFPLSLRRILRVTHEKEADVEIQFTIPRGDKDGSEFKKIELTFSDANTAQLWKENLIDLAFGGTYNETIKREILILCEKSDKDSQKLIEKYMVEIFESSKRPCILKNVQYNEFMIKYILSSLNFEKIGNILLTNPDFVPRLQQVIVREQYSTDPINLLCETDPVDAAVDVIRSAIGKKKLSTVHVTGLKLKREEKGLLSSFRK